MNQPPERFKQFIFDSYEFNKDEKLLSLHYALDDEMHFTETYRFNFDFVEYDEAVFDRAASLLWLMAGISYYKKFIPREIVVKDMAIDPYMAKFFSKTYQRGLGEFWYVNRLDPRTPINFPQNAEQVEA